MTEIAHLDLASCTSESLGLDLTTMPEQTQINPTFYRKIEQMMTAPAGSIYGDQRLSDLKGWDSLTILEFMMLASSDYDSDMQPDDIAACVTVDELVRATLMRSSRRPKG
jgi:acyl carrier protein